MSNVELAALLANISTGAYIAAGVFFALAVAAFFGFKIPEVIGDLSGRTAQRNIAKIRSANEKKGNKASDNKELDRKPKPSGKSGNQTLPLGGNSTLPLGGSQTLPLGGSETLPLGGSQTLPLGSRTAPIGADETTPLDADSTAPLGGSTGPIGLRTEKLADDGSGAAELLGGNETELLTPTAHADSMGTGDLTETLRPDGNETELLRGDMPRPTALTNAGWVLINSVVLVHTEEVIR